MQIVATESIIILLLNAMVCPVTIVVPHSYCAKWSNLTSTHNLPPSEANKGRRKIRETPPRPRQRTASSALLLSPSRIETPQITPSESAPSHASHPEQDGSAVHAPHRQCCHSHRASSGSRSEKSHQVPSWCIPRARSGVE